MGATSFYFPRNDIFVCVIYFIVSCNILYCTLYPSLVLNVPPPSPPPPPSTPPPPPPPPPRRGRGGGGEGAGGGSLVFVYGCFHVAGFLLLGATMRLC